MWDQHKIDRIYKSPEKLTPSMMDKISAACADHEGVRFAVLPDDRLVVWTGPKEHIAVAGSSQADTTLGTIDPFVDADYTMTGDLLVHYYRSASDHIARLSARIASLTGRAPQVTAHK